MLVFGLASVTTHINVEVSPSLTRYGLVTPELTSGLSVPFFEEVNMEKNQIFEKSLKT